MHKERLTLATIGGGAVQERVDRALEKVAKNIMDPNTDPGKKRVITLKITMKPNEDDREDVEVSADVQVSLAPEMGVSTHFFVSKDLKSDRVSVMEHRKGEIRGQLDFSDVGISQESEEDTRDRDREKLIICEAEVPRIPFEHFIDSEQMVITLQSMFVDEPEKTDKALILKFAGTVTNGSVKEYDDDGVTQKATIKQGVVSKQEAIVPSPCTLRPYRTFVEIEQPASQFIFRMKEGSSGNVTSALIEADGGAWKIKARESIKKYLEEKLNGMPISIIG